MADNVIVVDLVSYRRRNRRRVLAMVGMTASLVAAAIVWSVHSPRTPAPVCTATPAPTATVTSTVASATRSGVAPVPAWAGLLVGEGDTVTASGWVVAVPCQPVRLCTGNGGDFSSDPLSCPFGIPVLNVNLDTLHGRRVHDHAVTGDLSVRGVWRNGVLTVTSQSSPQRWRPTSEPPSQEPLPTPPCQPPPGGWLREALPRSEGPLHDYLQQHAGRFGPPWMSWPEGASISDSPLWEYRNRPMVLVIQVHAGSVTDAHAELRQVYPDNLCVIAAGDTVQPHPQWFLWSPPTPIFDQLNELRADPSNHIWSVTGGPTDDVTVEFFKLDQQLHDTLAELDHRKIALYPWLRPAP